MKFTDPLEFEEVLAPVGGEVRIRPMVGSRFRADIKIRPLPRVGLFKIGADSFSVQKEPRQDFYGFTIPLNAPFTVSDSGYEQTFAGSNAHMLSPGQLFNLYSNKHAHFMVCNFFVDALLTYKENILQETATGNTALEPRVPLVTATGSKLFRSVARAWVALGMDDSIIGENARQEIEDDLLANFLSLAEDPQAFDREALIPSDHALKRAEDYISANLTEAITRDQLAKTAGVPIRSLNRAFEKRYGSGPMAFVRQRRLDACYKKLVGSEPQSTTVSDVAMLYGFTHIGRFAIAYRKIFGESPSTSLRGASKVS